MYSKNKILKRFLPIIMAVLLLVGILAGCGARPTDTQSGAANSVASSAASKLEEPLPQQQNTAPSESQAATPQSTAPPAESPASSEPQVTEPEAPAIDEDGTYTTKEDVALYIYTYGKLPSNFITKKQAQALGWSGGSLEPYAPGCSIGGNRFGNYEGLLPEKDGRIYTECDINTVGAKSRGAERIVFSNDGLIYYTADHYESFELLYGEED